jgi:hypothetical protein
VGETDRRLLVYALLDPRTERVRYIGKSTRGLHRPKAHTAPSVLRLNAETYRGRWLAQLVALGLAPVVRVLEVCGTHEALSEAEIRWIARGRAEGWPLTNLTEGGDGTSGWKMPAATREKIRAKLKGHPALVAARRGKKLSPEHVAKIVAANTGKVRTPEMRARHAAKIAGHVMPAQTRAALLAANTGSQRSEESRAKMSVARKKRTGWKLSAAEYEARVQCARAGHTPEAKAKRSASMLRIWSDPDARARRLAAIRARAASPEYRSKMAVASADAWARRKAGAISQR